MIKLTVTSYNNEPLPQPLSALFDRDSGTIGRSIDCHLVLADPRRHVSRLQAAISWRNEHHIITNLSQANGLLINGQELCANHEQELHDGDEIIAGLYVLHVENTQLAANVGQIDRTIPNESVMNIESRMPAQNSPARQADSITLHPTTATPIQPVVELAMPQWPDIADRGGRNAAAYGENPFADLMSTLDISGVPVTGPFSEHGLTAPEQFDSASSTTLPEILPHEPPSKSDVQLQTSPRIEKSAALHVDFDDLLSGSTHGSPLPQQLGSAIPDDFNPFDLPSNAVRNSADPLEALAMDDVSLASFEHRIARSLISAAEDAPIASLLEKSNRSETVDPMLLFASEKILPRIESPVAIERTYSNHVQELHSPFQMPTNYFQTAGNDSQIKQFSELAPAPLTLKGEVAQSAVAFSENRLANVDQTPSTEAPQTEQNEHFSEDPESSKRRASTLAASTSMSASDAVPDETDTGELPAPIIPNHLLTGDERQALLDAFIEGAEIVPDSMTAPLTPDLMRSIGQMLAAATQGTVELISSRALVKREVKADVTMIVVKNNNPLKFLPDGQTALTQMFGRKIPGFMEPVEAMNDAYEDLRAHQIGVVAGMRAALDDVLKRFNPAHLEKRLKQPSIIESILPATRKARKWDLHHDLFQAIHAESQDDFQTLFGKAFLNAYEDEIERFKRINPR